MGRYFTVVGIKYYDYESHKDMIQEGDTVFLEKELDNKFDKNAVVVYFPFDDLKIGYISAKETEYLFEDLENCIFIINSFYKNTMIIEEIIKNNSSQSEIEKQSIVDTVKKFFGGLKK